MKLHTLLQPELIQLDLPHGSTEEVLQAIVGQLKREERISNEKLILNKLIEREKLGSTSIGNHAAVPHTKIKGLKEPILFMGLSRKGIRYHENDHELVHLIVLILSPNDSPIIHLQILAAAAAFIKKSENLVKEILSANSADALIQLVKKYENAGQ